MRYTTSSFLIIIIVFLISAATGDLMRTDTMWYRSLVQPSWSPPRWVFGPAWSIIYILIAVGLVRIWNVFDKDILLYGVLALLFINAYVHVAWPYLFAQQHMLGASALDLGVMVITICCAQALIVTRDVTSFLLFLPYTLWSCYALSLNIGLWFLN